MGEEGDEAQGSVDRTRTLIRDVADLDDPLLMKEHFANLMSGLRVLDISDIGVQLERGAVCGEGEGEADFVGGV